VTIQVVHDKTSGTGNDYGVAWVGAQHAGGVSACAYATHYPAADTDDFTHANVAMVGSYAYLADNGDTIFNFGFACPPGAQLGVHITTVRLV
jgi:hypothetical protein